MGNGIGLDVEAIAGLEIQLGKTDKDDLVSRIVGELRGYEPIPYRMQNSQQCDSNGNLLMKVGTCPDGYVFDITALIQLADGSNSHSPTLGTPGTYWNYYYGNAPNNAELIDTGPADSVNGAVFPKRTNYPDNADPMLSSGKPLLFQLVGVGALANVNVTVTACGILIPKGMKGSKIAVA